MRNTIAVFDIETGSLPLVDLVANMPPFDPSEVKVGNIKDPQLIEDKIEAARVKHRTQYVDNAALDARTGKVITWGIKSDGLNLICPFEKEVEILEHFWAQYGEITSKGYRMVGFNIFNFDLPFLIKRSWKHRVRIPATVRNGRYWSDSFIDLRDVWQCGDRMAGGSLDSICQHLGVGAKNGNGKDFAALWDSDRASALQYLGNDLDMTAALAGVILP